MIQILFDIDMPKSCAKCPFMVHCDTCESWENYCPLLHEHVGYDYNEPYTPKDHRRENCPLKEAVERPHGKIIVDEDGNTSCSRCGNTLAFGNFCNNCGADFREEKENETGN